MRRVDVLVVGGGPAGSTTALRLARRGYEVLLIDRAHFPRAKACGDCISPQANILLDQLGLLDALRAEEHTRLDGWRIFAHDGRSFGARFQDCTRDPSTVYGFAMQRSRFDRILLDAARAAGVDVHENTTLDSLRFDRDRVTGAHVRGSGESTIAARFVVGADGLRSPVRSQLRLEGRKPRLRKVALTAHAVVPGLSETGEMHLADGRCLGLAPVGQHANVTLVVDRDRFGRSLRGKQPDVLREHFAQFPAARERMAQTRLDHTEILASGPFDRPTTGVLRAGAALVGDAAGYYDPFTGQGIFQALQGSAYLADAAADFLESGRIQVLQAYERQLLAMLRSGRRVQRLIEYVSARFALMQSSARALRHAPLAAQRLIAVTGDVARPASLLSPLVLGSFLTGFSQVSSAND